MRLDPVCGFNRQYRFVLRNRETRPCVPFEQAAAQFPDLPVEGIDHDGAVQNAKRVPAPALPGIQPGQRLAGRDIVLVHGRNRLEHLHRRFGVVQLEVYFRQQFVRIAGVRVMPVEGPGAFKRRDGFFETRLRVQRLAQHKVGVETHRVAAGHLLQCSQGQLLVPRRFESKYAPESGAPFPGIIRESPVEVAHGHSQHLANDFSGGSILVVQVQHAPERLESKGVHDVFHDDRGLVVGKDDLATGFRPGETPVQFADGEQFALDRRLREFRLQVHVPLRPGETGLVDGDALRQPAGDAVARLLQMDDVDVLVPERLAPVERPLFPGTGRIRHHYLPETDPEQTARPRHAGDAYHEVVVVRQDLDEHGFIRHEAVSRRDRPVGFFEQAKGHFTVDGIFVAMEFQRETVAGPGLEIFEGIEQLQRIVRAGIEGVFVERLFKHSPAFRHLADTGQVDPQSGIGRPEGGVGLYSPAAHFHGLPEPVAPRKQVGDDLVEPAIGRIDPEYAPARRFVFGLPALAMIGGGQQGMGLR